MSSELNAGHANGRTSDPSHSAKTPSVEVGAVETRGKRQSDEGVKTGRCLHSRNWARR